MSDFNSLEIGKRALLAQRFGLDITSNNIANINTPGYSRRTVILSETTPKYESGTFLGTGVLVDKLRTFREEFFDKEIRSSLARQAGYETDEEIIKKVEAIFGEPSDNGLSEIVTQFFNAFQEISLKPENIALRDNILSIAQTMIDRLHSIHSQLTIARKDILLATNDSISNANKIIEKIAKLNKSISETKSLSDPGAQTLIDQREELLEDLSKIININATQNDNGTVNVYINGINIITSSVYDKIKVLESVSGNETTLQIVKVDKNDNILNILNPQSGEVASQLKHYNVTLDENDSSGGFSILKKLNEFASAFAQKVNTITVGGFGLDDTGTVPPGRSFFDPALNITAANIEISTDVKGKPRDIPLSDTALEPGNSVIGLQIANLANDATFLNGEMPAEYYSNLLASIGSLGFEASAARNTTTLVTDQLLNQRESVIGVNLDEEAINLIRYQKAFEAASRVIATTNELLGTIVNLGR